jgi:hypothetical protein
VRFNCHVAPDNSNLRGLIYPHKHLLDARNPADTLLESVIQLRRKGLTVTETKGTSFDETMWTGLLHGGLGGTFMGVPYVAPQREALMAAGA